MVGRRLHDCTTMNHWKLNIVIGNTRYWICEKNKMRNEEISKEETWKH